MVGDGLVGKTLHFGFRPLPVLRLTDIVGELHDEILRIVGVIGLVLADRMEARVERFEVQGVSGQMKSSGSHGDFGNEHVLQTFSEPPLLSDGKIRQPQLTP